MALTKIPSSLLDTSGGFDLQGNITLGDSEQIQLGNDGDLKVYHSGTNSFIKDQGTGSLYIDATNLYLRSATNENFLYCNADGAVTLYHDDSPKIATSSAGATVTGTLTVTGDLNLTGDINSYNVTDLDITDQTITLGAGQTEALSGGSGIIIDGSSASILWDETNDVFDINKGINILDGLSIENGKLTINEFTSPSAFTQIRKTNTGSNLAIVSQESIYMLLDENNDQTNRAFFIEHGAGSPGTGTTVFKVEESGNVGIGISSPGHKLHIDSNGNSNSVLRIDANDNRGANRYAIDIVDDDTNSRGSVRISTTSGPSLITTGSVGIGTSDPANLLHVEGSTNGAVQIEVDNQNTGNASYAGLYLNGQGNNFFLKNWGDQVPGKSNITEFISTANGSQFAFSTVSTEAMRIDSSGNVGIGISTIEQLGSDSVYPRIQSYSSATSGHFCGLMIGRPNSPGLESSLAFTVGGIMVGKIQHDYVASNHNDMSFHLRGATPGTDIEVMRLWAGSGTDTALLVGRTTRSWANADFEVESNARIGNIYFTGSGSDSTISAGNGNFKFSTLTATGGGTGLDFDVNIVVSGVGIANRFKVDSPTGDTYTNDGTISSLSDIRVKTDINDLTDGLEIVKQLRPVTFKYNDNSTDDDGNGMLAAADDKIRYGFIAQEVEEVAPHYVETSTRKINNEEVDDFKSLSTTRMIPMLFKAIQEQQTIIDDLKARIDTLENA